MSSPKNQRRLEFWTGLQPKIQYPSLLPVSKRSEDITRAIAEHPVLIIAGETGSGKTTQVPKCALQAGLGQKGRILMTQPRRLAAVRTALRIAEELGVEPGQEVGYRVRFQHKAHAQGLLEVVTDGIPLSGDLSQRPFKDCEAVIVDEVHERSVNIDLLLGLLKQERVKNPNFKIILMSATLDTERYREFFPEAHAMEVEGRTYPVDIFYHKPERNSNLSDRVCGAVEEALQHSGGDLLCFMATERDIRDVERRLSTRLGSGFEVLPLFSRLSQKDQDKVFRPASGGKRKVILSTNIAETSLTLPGVRCVVDTGQVRMLRFQAGRGVPLLEVESISKASAKQRAGRAGRTAPGVCLRLYEERDYIAMEDFTIPEIQRQDLSTVILKLISMGVRNPEDFPFPDRPSSRAMKSGERQLEFLGAVTRQEDGLHLTKMGRDMVRQPLSPRLSHLMLNAQKEGELLDIAVISAFLSMQDPRQNPSEQLSKARDAHRKFQEGQSDFMGILKLFKAYQRESQERSGNGLKRWCSDNFLAWRRMREWEQLILDLGKTVDKSFKLETLKATKEESIHRLILGSHLDCVLEPDAKADDGSYHSLGRRSIFPHPSSCLSKGPHAWSVCAAFLNTSRLFALHLCHIEARWIAEIAPHLIQIERGDPRYDSKTQKVVSEEIHRFRSHVVKTVASKDHFPYDPEAATDVFIREALIREPIPSLDLKKSLQTYQQLQHCDGAMRVREQCYNEDRMVEAWVKKIGLCSRYSDLKKLSSDKLQLELFDVLDLEERQHMSEDTPLHIDIDGETCSVEYRYAPGQSKDGASVLVLPQQLAKLTQRELENTAPAWIAERHRIAWECLPKAFKKNFSHEQCLQTWQDMWAEQSDSSAKDIWRRWISKHTALDDIVEQWLQQIDQKTPATFTPQLIVIDAKGKRGDRIAKVEDAQVHNLAAMEERHFIGLKKKERLKVGPLEGDALELIQKALELRQAWPATGKEARDLRNHELKLYPLLYRHRGDWWIEPHRDAESAHQRSMIELARLHGPISAKEPSPDPELVERLVQCDSELSSLLSTSLTASWENLWLRMRECDLLNVDKLRLRLKKCEDKYWQKDLQRLLRFCLRCVQLSTRAKWLHPKTSQEHWLSKRCGKACFFGRPEPERLSRVNLDQASLEIEWCLVFLEEQHRNPENFDSVCQGWRQLEKQWKDLSRHPLYTTCFEPTGTFHGDLFEGQWNDASEEQLSLAQERLKLREEQCRSLQKRWNEAEDWLDWAKDDLDAECQVKSRNKKKQMLGELHDAFPDGDSRRLELVSFCDAVENCQKSWKQLRSQKKVVLEEEKILEKDKLKDALLTAWNNPKTTPRSTPKRTPKTLPRR